MTLLPDSPVDVVMTKWGDGRHWEFAAVFLGTDDCGDWLGVAAGTRMSRPGAEYVAPTRQVLLVPPAGADGDRGWLATFHDIGGPVRVYVDMTTPPVWDGATLRAVDLDLDVILGLSGRLWVDDEDEFAEHQVSLGYPREIIDLATSTATAICAAIREPRAPFAGQALPWFDRFAG